MAVRGLDLGSEDDELLSYLVETTRAEQADIPVHGSASQFQLVTVADPVSLNAQPEEEPTSEAYFEGQRPA